MNPLIGAVTDTLIEHGIALGDQLIREGARLIRESISGQASDEKIMDWLREAQSVAIQKGGHQ